MAESDKSPVRIAWGKLPDTAAITLDIAGKIQPVLHLGTKRQLIDRGGEDGRKLFSAGRVVTVIVLEGVDPEVLASIRALVGSNPADATAAAA